MIGDNGARILAEVLKWHKSIIHIDLSGNMIAKEVPTSIGRKRYI
jgi:hypothetical protein